MLSLQCLPDTQGKISHKLKDGLELDLDVIHVWAKMTQKENREWELWAEDGNLVDGQEGRRLLIFKRFKTKKITY